MPTSATDCWTLSKSVPGVFFTSVSTTYQCCQNKTPSISIGSLPVFKPVLTPWCWRTLDVLLVLLLSLDSCGTLSVFYVWTFPLFGFYRPLLFHNWWPESIMVISNPAGNLFVSFSVARIMTENCVAYSCSWPNGKSTLLIHGNCVQWMIFVVTCAFVVIPANTFILCLKGQVLAIELPLTLRRIFHVMKSVYDILRRSVAFKLM